MNMFAGVVMPLENNMEKPQKFIGTFGVLNVGAVIITVIYTLFGLMGYLTYGKDIDLYIPKQFKNDPM